MPDSPRERTVRPSAIFSRAWAAGASGWASTIGAPASPASRSRVSSGIKKAREAITGVRGQLHETLGDDFDHLRDIDLRQYHPKTFIRQQLLADDDEPPTRRGSATARAAAAAAAAGTGVRTPPVPRDAATPPPFDVDAT